MSINVGSTTKSFAKWPMPTISALLCAAVVWLSIQNKVLADKNTDIQRLAKIEIAEIERRCSTEKDALRLEQIATLNVFLQRQQKIEDQLRSLQRRK